MPEKNRGLKRATEIDQARNGVTLTGTDKRGGRKLHRTTQNMEMWSFQSMEPPVEDRKRLKISSLFQGLLQLGQTYFYF